MLWLSKVRSTKHGLWSFYYFAVKTWNAMPDSICAIAGIKELLRSIRFFFFYDALLHVPNFLQLFTLFACRLLLFIFLFVVIFSADPYEL